MLVGFHVTFLIQHSIGLDGMPRRIYEYSDVGHLELYNLISTIGSFILAAGVLVTAVNVRPQRQARRRSPGPDPWKGNTLEWFTTSPPPVNNFDVVPRVRSVEPMKDIRRQVERQIGADRRRGAAGARVRGAHLMSRAARQRRRALAAWRARASWWPTTSTLTKPKRPVAAALHDRDDDARRRLPVGAADPARRAWAATCRAGGAGAVNHSFDRDIDAQMAAHGRPARARGPRLGPRRADLRLRAGRGSRSSSCRSAVNPLAAALVAQRLPRLRRSSTRCGSSAARRRTSSSAAPRAPCRRSSAGPRSPAAWTAWRSTSSRSSSSGRRRTSGRSRC